MAVLPKNLVRGERRRLERRVLRYGLLRTANAIMEASWKIAVCYGRHRDFLTNRTSDGQFRCHGARYTSQKKAR